MNIPDRYISGTSSFTGYRLTSSQTGLYEYLANHVVVTSGSNMRYIRRFCRNKLALETCGWLRRTVAHDVDREI